MDNSAMCLAQLLSKYNRFEKVLIGERQTSNKKKKIVSGCNTKNPSTSGEVVFFTQTNHFYTTDPIKS